MRQYLRYILTIAVTTFIIFEVIVVGIIKFPGGVFYPSYQSLIADKYRLLQETNEPKIIIVAGSSSAFGLDQKMLEDMTGYKVVNLGLHAGFGRLFYSELAKENLNKGDIVLLAYEYGWQEGFDHLAQDLIMSGIDENIDMYKHIPMSRWSDFVGYIFKYAETKNAYAGASGTYSRESFDSKTGQMIIDREFDMDYAENVGAYGQVDLTGVIVSDDAIEYLKDFKFYVESKGASVYFISPPVLNEAIVCDYAEFENLKQQEEEKIGIQYISNPQDYFFENELMADTIYHCSTKGEKVRTRLIVDDLKRASIIK